MSGNRRPFPRERSVSLNRGPFTQCANRTQQPLCWHTHVSKVTCPFGPVWQPGRIVEVHKKVESKPLYWIVNTPITEDETTYTITVHVGTKLLVGIGRNIHPR